MTNIPQIPLSTQDHEAFVRDCLILLLWIAAGRFPKGSNFEEVGSNTLDERIYALVERTRGRA